MSLIAVPISLVEANEFVMNFHRHNKKVPVARFSIGCSHHDKLVGVSIVAWPVARALMDGFTAEVARCCVVDDAPKGACSFLYGASWRAWRAMGGRRMTTYTLQSESGASMRGAGWKVVAELPGRPPSGQWTTRPGREWQSVVGQAKIRWEVNT